ncbi:MAG TPA: LacI family DNA-binding transcriptional regulator, partial [Actinotalea sp.]|nr:LacI family DNA-binding transcriptional regulator [Actinotalea sp.]
MRTRATQADVARRAGVSRQTVSLVVLGDPRVSPQRRAAVEAAMREVGYRPNAAARSLVRRRTGLLGVLVSGLVNPFLGELAEQLRVRAEEHGFVPLLATVAEDPESERRALERFLELRVDGLVLVSPLLDLSALEAVGSQVPTVVLTRNAGPPTVDLVHTDDVTGADRATEHLLAAGYAPVVLVGHQRQAYGDSSRARAEGYAEAMARVGLTPRHADVDPLDHEGVRAVVRELRSGTGLVCHNDLVALAALGAVVEAGLAVGRDVGVTGFDNTMLGGLPGIALT